MKAEINRLACALPIATGGFEHVERAGNVGVDEIGGAVDGPIDMAFSSKVHHGGGAVQIENPVKGRAIADIGLLKAVEVGFGGIGDVLEARGIGEGVEVDHLMPALHCQSDDSGTDETSAACDQQLHMALHSKGDFTSANRGAIASLPDKTGVPERPQSMPMVGSSQRTAPSQSGA